MLRRRPGRWTLVFAGVFVLLGGCAPQPAIAPNRIVSNNPCIDAVLAEVAAPQQIGAVSGDVLASTNWDAASYVPPVHTKTWFHTGAWRPGESLVSAMKRDFWRGGPPGCRASWPR